MDTSDDPITLSVTAGSLLAGGAAAGGALALGGAFGKSSLLPDEFNLFGDKGAVDAIGEPEPEEKTKTATGVPQVSEQARRNRRRQSSFLSRGFASPTLGATGRLG
jgi:hypothetical protein